MIKCLPIATAGCYMATSIWVKKSYNTDRLPRKGKAIYVSNHSSLLDGVIITSHINWHKKRMIHTISINDPFNHWLLGWCMRSSKCIPYHRGEPGAVEDLIRTSLSYLAVDEQIALFPEGHLNNGKSLRLPRPGAALMALESGAPIIPVGLRNTQEVFPLHGKIKYERKVTMHIGKAIETASLSERYHSSGKEERALIVENILYQMMEQISELSGMPMHRRMKKPQPL